jgi:hypothetical protein
VRGFAASGAPLSPAELLEDIAPDLVAGGFATAEPFPHDGALAVAIHPCRQASALAKLAAIGREGVLGTNEPGLSKASGAASGAAGGTTTGAAAGAPPDLPATAIFPALLKFWASGIPFVEADWTAEAGAVA